MKIVKRSNDKYRPSFNPNRDLNYISDTSITNLIKRADEICKKYNFDYNTQIYKVELLFSSDTMNNSGVRFKSGKTRYKGCSTTHLSYYEVKLRKIGA